jgi:hypothetical protein
MVEGITCKLHGGKLPLTLIVGKVVKITWVK